MRAIDSPGEQRKMVRSEEELRHILAVLFRQLGSYQLDMAKYLFHEQQKKHDLTLDELDKLAWIAGSEAKELGRRFRRFKKLEEVIREWCRKAQKPAGS
jgi:hypothetical protein